MGVVEVVAYGVNGGHGAIVVILGTTSTAPIRHDVDCCQAIGGGGGRPQDGDYDVMTSIGPIRPTSTTPYAGDLHDRHTP
jgi:hypothetical protein